MSAERDSKRQIADAINRQLATEREVDDMLRRDGCEPEFIIDVQSLPPRAVVRRREADDPHKLLEQAYKDVQEAAAQCTPEERAEALRPRGYWLQTRMPGQLYAASENTWYAEVRPGVWECQHCGRDEGELHADDCVTQLARRRQAGID